MSDLLNKKIQILKLLPKAPARISASEIHQKLMERGIEVHKRTVQRDLNDLAKQFPIENDGNKDIPGWSWQKDAKKLELPEMDVPVALSFQMVKTYLNHLMPPSVLENLKDYFINADKALNDEKNRLAHWPEKIATLSRTQPLLAPQMDHEILSKIYWALLTDTQIKAVYQPKNKTEREYLIHPLGIVVMDQIIYLVATLWEYEDIKQLALHRFQLVENSEQKITRPGDFSLQNYIEKGHFEYLASQEEPTIQLELKIHKQAAKHLYETPLSEDQTLKPIEDSEFEVLTATVKNTHQLRWWILGLGAAVKVIQPQSLQAKIQTSLEQSLALYQNKS